MHKDTGLNPLPIVRDKDGNVYTRVDVLAMSVTRWNANKKLFIVQALQNKVVSAEDVLQKFRIEAEELRRWVEALKDKGVNGLKMRPDPPSK